MEEFVRLEPVAQGLEVSALVIAMQSAMDAGAVSQIVAEHLTSSLQHERVATFSADQLMDFHRHRPVIVYEDGRFTDLVMGELAIDLVRDDEGKQVLLLHGIEPDLQWNRFREEMLSLADRFGVNKVYVLQGFPTGVPHTRPVQLTAHASRPELLPEGEGIMGSLQVPAQMANALELAFGQRGTDAIGFSAAIPYYLAHHSYSAGAAALVRRLASAERLALPVGELDAAAAQFEAEVIADFGEETMAHVRALEMNFDALRESQPQLFSAASPEAIDEHIPTAEEIGAAAEAFLADLDENRPDGDSFGG